MKLFVNVEHMPIFNVRATVDFLPPFVIFSCFWLVLAFFGLSALFIKRVPDTSYLSGVIERLFWDIYMSSYAIISPIVLFPHKTVFQRNIKEYIDPPFCKLFSHTTNIANSFVFRNTSSLKRNAWLKIFSLQTHYTFLRLWIYISKY